MDPNLKWILMEGIRRGAPDRIDRLVIEEPRPGGGLKEDPFGAPFRVDLKADEGSSLQAEFLGEERVVFCPFDPGADFRQEGIGCSRTPCLKISLPLEGGG